MAQDILTPGDGNFLSPNEVVQKLKREFKHVQASKKKGRECVEEQIADLRWLQKEGKNPLGPPIKDQIRFLESCLDKAIQVVIADRENPGDAVLCADIFPETPIVFGYYSAANQRESQPLVKRCAKVLSYEIE